MPAPSAWMMELIERRTRRMVMRTPALAAAALLLGVGAACSDGSAPGKPVETEPAVVASSTSSENAENSTAEPAPSGYRAVLVGTRMNGWVLKVRTFGSSSCPLQMDSVTLVGSVIEVVDQEPQVNDDIACTLDYGPSWAEYAIKLTKVEPYLAAKSVVLTTLSGDRFSMDLKFALE